MQNEKTPESENFALRAACESNIIGAAAVDEKTFREDCLPYLFPACFRNEVHRRAYVTAATMIGAGMSIDQRVLGCELRKVLEDKRETAVYLDSVSNDGYQGPGTVPYYVHELLRLHAVDTHWDAAERLQADLVDGIPVETAMAKFRLATENSITSPTRFTSLAEAASESIRIHRETLTSGARPSFETPYEELNDATGGVYPGQLFLISGVSFVGKTHFALRLASHFADHQIPTLFNCMEMKDWELAERELVRRTRYDASLFANSLFVDDELDDLERITKEQLTSVPLYFDCSPGETASTIAGKARYAVAKHGVKVLFVDHLQRLTRDPRQELRHHLKESCKQLKDLALELDIAVVLLTQLKIEGDNREPTAASYSEAKQIFEEADNAILLHKPADEKKSLKVIVAKARKRSATEFNLRFDGKQYVDEVPSFSSDFTDH